MSEAFVFTAKGLSVGYKGKPLISDISFSLPRGSILTLIGPNGAGKSTILKTITRQLSAIAGTAFETTRDKKIVWSYAPAGRRLSTMTVLPAGK